MGIPMTNVTRSKMITVVWLHWKRSIEMSGSAHGTYIGTLRIEGNKPTQLPIDSTFHFGASTRYYTIRERPQTATRPILEELEEEAKTENQVGGLLGLPETETELDVSVFFSSYTL